MMRAHFQCKKLLIYKLKYKRHFLICITNTHVVRIDILFAGFHQRPVSSSHNFMWTSVIHEQFCYFYTCAFALNVKTILFCYSCWDETPSRTGHCAQRPETWQYHEGGKR